MLQLIENFENFRLSISEFSEFSEFGLGKYETSEIKNMEEI